MAIDEKEYRKRLIEKKLEDYLSVFGAVSIEEPKWCGKTWTSLRLSKSEVYMDDDDVREMAKLDVKSILNIDMNEGTEKRRNKDKMRMLLKSLARNEASIVGNKTIIKDIEEYENGTELLSSRDTVIDYLDVLDDILEDVKHLVSL